MSEWFENGILRVLVPSGWKLFYGIDSEGNASPRNLHIFKGAQTELDVFSKAGITVFYHGTMTPTVSFSSATTMYTEWHLTVGM